MKPRHIALETVQLGDIPAVQDRCHWQSTESNRIRADSGAMKGNGWKEVDPGGFNGNRQLLRWP
jgi:hypothetical protein